MLILTRRPGESIKIGDEVTVTVLGINGNQLRLGFSAPRHIAVHREEIYQRIQAARVTRLAPVADDLSEPPLRAVNS